MAKRNLWKRKYEKVEQELASERERANANGYDLMVASAEARSLRGHIRYLGEIIRAEAERIDVVIPHQARMLRSTADAYAPVPTKPITNAEQP